MTWTRFFDMHSGGGNKIKKYEYIYIEADYTDAINIFKNRFDRNPYNVTCTCCGEDFSINVEGDDLHQATAHERNCEYDDKEKCYKEKPNKYCKKHIPLEEWIIRPDVYIIRKEDISSNDLRDYEKDFDYD